MSDDDLAPGEGDAGFVQQAIPGRGQFGNSPAQRAEVAIVHR